MTVQSSSPTPTSSRVGMVLLSIVFVLCTATGGALLGGVWVRFFAQQVTNGWDGIAQALGGLMAGAAIGLIAALLFLIPLVRRGQAAIGKAALAALVIAGLTLAVLVITRPERPKSESFEPPKKAFQPVTRISLRVAQSDELLRQLTRDEVPFQWASYKVESYGANGPHLDLEEYGPDRRFCSTAISEDDLRTLIAALKPAMAYDEICRTPEDDRPISFGWRVSDQNPERGGATTDSDCLDERPEIVAVATALDDLAELRAEELECRELPEY